MIHHFVSRQDVRWPTMCTIGFLLVSTDILPPLCVPRKRVLVTREFVAFRR
jgi:hypothetical protein